MENVSLDASIDWSKIITCLLQLNVGRIKERRITKSLTSIGIQISHQLGLLCAQHFGVLAILTIASELRLFLANLDRLWTLSTCPELCPFRCCFYLKFCNFGTIFTSARFMPKTSIKIAWHEPNDMPTSSVSFLQVIVIRRLFNIIFFTASMFSPVVGDLGIFSAFLKPVMPKLNLYSARIQWVSKETEH